MLAIQSRRLAVNDVEPELRSDDNLLSLPAERTPEQLFIFVRPINFRRVEKIDPQLQRPIDRGQRLLLIRRPIRLAHPHTPEALGRNNESLRSQLALVHTHNATPLRLSASPREPSPDEPALTEQRNKPLRIRFSRYASRIERQ